MVDHALHVRGLGARLVVRDVATRDREGGDAGLGDLGGADGSGGELEAAERLDEAAVERDRGVLATQRGDLGDGLDGVGLGSGGARGTGVVRTTAGGCTEGE